MSCTACGCRSLFRDAETSSLACSSCGTVQAFDSYEAQTFAYNGPVGVRVRIGTSGTGSVLSYHERKVYLANKIVEEHTSRLNLSEHKVDEVKTMISNITEGEFGLGNWFSILVGACTYVIMRSDKKNNTPLPIEEVSNAVGCDVHELGRMVKRVVGHLDMKLPVFDIVNSFEKVVKNFLSLRNVEGETAKRMTEQGVFLIQCSVKWFLTTGRRPLPLVVAVVVLVAELNCVKGVNIDQVASELSVAGSTCRLRYRELLEMIVKVAKQALPWGKDVTIKNAVKNTPYVLHYMEKKSMEKCQGDGEDAESAAFDMEEIISECLRKDFEYVVDKDAGKSFGSQYFELQHENEFDKMGADGVDKLQLSHECLAMAYNVFLKESDFSKHLGGRGKVNAKKREEVVQIRAGEWWNGKSELSKKLMLKQLLEKDVGFNALPPSFMNGCTENERRKAKINAARQRIGRIMRPLSADAGNSGEICMFDAAQARKRKRKSLGNLDWEDFIIETLLLHQVKEEEIVTGHYNTLLDLHVFNS